MMPPRAAHAARRRRRETRSDEAPFHCGSDGGKCSPMSPSAERAEDRVGQRVQDDVGVRVADQAAVCGIATPPSMTCVAGAEGVDVDSRCRRARRRGAARRRPASRRSAAAISSAVVSLTLAGIAGTTRDRDARPFGDRRIVGERPRPAARRALCAARIASKRSPAASRPRGGRRAARSRRRRRRRRRASACSATGRAGTTASSAVERRRSRDRSAPAETNGRAASWISTRSGGSAASAVRPASTDSCRVAPPVTGAAALDRAVQPTPRSGPRHRPR